MRWPGDRAVSTALGYVLSLGITAILISGLLLAGGNFVEGERTRVTQTELDVVGQRLASQLTSADRAAMTVDADGTLVIEARLPDRIAGTPYGIEITEEATPDGAQNTYTLTLRTRTPDVTTSVSVHTTTPLLNATVDGGTLRIRYVDSDDDGDTGKDSLEVTDG